MSAMVAMQQLFEASLRRVCCMQAEDRAVSERRWAGLPGAAVHCQCLHNAVLLECVKSDVTAQHMEPVCSLQAAVDHLPGGTNASGRRLQGASAAVTCMNTHSACLL